MSSNSGMTKSLIKPFSEPRSAPWIGLIMSREEEAEQTGGKVATELWLDELTSISCGSWSPKCVCVVCCHHVRTVNNKQTRAAQAVPFTIATTFLAAQMRTRTTCSQGRNWERPPLRLYCANMFSGWQFHGVSTADSLLSCKVLHSSIPRFFKFRSTSC